jgi:vitamin B12/bleomycin/antimicrobial peptide transport system ATP-binding/permease protein
MRRVIDIAREFFALALPYFRSEEKWQARALLAGVVISEFGVVYALVVFNIWNGYFFNSIQDRNWDNFIWALLLFIGIAAWTVVATMCQFFFGQTLIMRWRRWLTEQYVSKWVADGRHYRMQFADTQVDNAHLRIANDILIFLQKTHDLGYNFLGSLIALASFAYILWGLSSTAPLLIFGTDYSFPGYLFWIAIAYAAVGTAIAHFIGQPLIGYNFKQQRYESDFRFAIVRVWDHAEPVALMRGEPIERKILNFRFGELVKNWTRLIRRQTGLTAFTTGYAQTSLVFPFLVASPGYFAGTIPLGTLMQASFAFQRVDIAFAFFLHSYAKIAEWKASMDRVAQLNAALFDVDAPRDAKRHILLETSAGGDVKVSDLEVSLPNGMHIASVKGFDLKPGDRALITGPSGSGKSSVLRALAGIWATGKGAIEVPKDTELLALPQTIYFPLGTLRTAITYPTAPENISEERLHQVLKLVGLERFEGQLDEEADWSVVLSGGEQQRIGLARALLRKPDILFLDEPTSNFDEATGRELYKALLSQLPETTVISVGRTGSLADLHGRTIETRDGIDTRRGQKRPPA